MKTIAWIPFLQLFFTSLTFGQQNYLKTGELPDYSKSKAYSYIAYLDRLLKPNGDIEKWIKEGNTDKAKRTLSNLDLNLNNVRETDPTYPLEGFIAKRTLLTQQLNGKTETVVTPSQKATSSVAKIPNTTSQNSTGSFNLPDYSKSRAYNSIDYLNRMLKPDGTIEKLLKKGENGRAMDIAEGIETHMNTVKEQDPSFPVSIFENRRQVLVAQANKSYQSERADQHAQEDHKRALSEKSGLLNQILLENDYQDYFVTKDYNGANFIEALEALNWKQTKEDLAAYVREFPNETEFTRLKKFEQSFQEQQNNWLADAISTTIDFAYQRAEHSKPEARKYARIALSLTEACLSILPNDRTTQNLKKSAQKAVATYAPNYPSDLHGQNAGKLLFSSQLMVHKKENQGQIKTSFKAGEPIYAMAYLDGAIKDFTYASPSLILEVYVDGNYKTDHRFSASKLSAEQMFVDIEILPDPSKIRHEGPENYAKGLQSISPRKHQVEIRLVAGLSGVIGVGKFELDASAGTAPIAALHEKYQAFNAANVCLQASKRNDPALEKNMVAAFKATGWEQKPVKATIFDANWRIVKHSVTGRILYRAIRGELTAQSPKGYCLLYFMDYMQEYQGNGSYSSTVKVRQSLGSKRMDCKNLTKVK